MTEEYLKQIAANTAKANEWLEEIHTALELGAAPGRPNPQDVFYGGDPPERVVDAQLPIRAATARTLLRRYRGGPQDHLRLHLPLVS